MLQLRALALVMILCLPAAAWDSRHSNPTHPTHSYLTEWAIDQLADQYPALKAPAVRKALLDGANSECHELPLDESDKTLGNSYGLDLEARRVEHQGTNEGSNDVEGWWNDARAAYQAGNELQAYYLLGVLLHMVEDMGVPAHANMVVHQGNAREFDNFEAMALSNWKPDWNDWNVDRTDPTYELPSNYYQFSREWTQADAPDYHDRDKFSKVWTFASKSEKTLLSNRQARTCNVVKWTLASGLRAFGVLTQ
ncbi:MAG: hypothetical protein AB7S38_00120 [Vulcanimicrobiota bacterium]